MPHLLKRLELNGFKSFAQRTVLEFTGGITAIVGPNGSGKSNIVDAVRWLLGEREAKHLRGARIDELIFAGTAKRPRLGMAWRHVARREARNPDAPQVPGPHAGGRSGARHRDPRNVVLRPILDISSKR